MLNRMRKPSRASGFGADSSSVAALEFALVLPLLLVLVAGVYDLSELIIIRAEIYNAAESMVASASSLAVQQDGSTALYYDQVQAVESTIWADVPSLRDGLKSGSPKAITISSVHFVAAGSNPVCTFNATNPCTYWADVLWSEAYAGAGTGAAFQPNIAATDCAKYFTDQSNQVAPTASLSGLDNVNKFRTLNVASDGTLAAPNNTEADDAGIPPILAVSIEYTYTPLFSLYLAPSYTFWVDAYWPVRSTKNTGATTLIFSTEEPLVHQFTTLIGNPNTGYNNTSLYSSPAAQNNNDVNSNYVCVNNADAASFPPISSPIT